MRKQYTTEYLREFLGEEGADPDGASRLLDAEVPGVKQRVERAVKALKKALDDIHQVFPEAEYYTPGGEFGLLLGKSHTDVIYCGELRRMEPNQMLSVTLNTPMLPFGGGNW